MAECINLPRDTKHDYENEHKKQPLKAFHALI